MKVDFIILGAQKCGTSTLFDILSKHTSIEGSKIKEPHFFSTSRNWKADLPNYEALFNKRENVKYFEASTSYTFYPHRKLSIWNDLYEYNPNLKFIYIVRNPIERILSSYMHNFQRGYTDTGIEDAVLKNPMYMDVTRYYTQIIPFIRKFGREKVFILDFEEMIKKREDTIRLISEFLHLPFDGFQNYGHIHSNKSIGGQKKHYKFDHPGPMLKATQKLFPRIWRLILNKSSRTLKERPVLSKEYQEVILHMLDLEIGGLQEILNKDLTFWKFVH